MTRRTHGRTGRRRPASQILVETETDASKCQLRMGQAYLREAEVSESAGESSAHEAGRRDVAEDYAQCK